jgi:hypothetical protein
MEVITNSPFHPHDAGKQVFLSLTGVDIRKCRLY